MYIYVYSIVLTMTGGYFNTWYIEQNMDSKPQSTVDGFE